MGWDGLGWMGGRKRMQDRMNDRTRPGQGHRAQGSSRVGGVDGVRARESESGKEKQKKSTTGMKTK